MSRRSIFVVSGFALALAPAVLAAAILTAGAPGGKAPATVAGGDARACSLSAAVRSIGRVFRGLNAGNAQEILNGFVERQPIGKYAWGFQIERPEEGPHGLSEDSSSSRLIGVTIRGIETLVARRRGQDERLVLVALHLDTTPTRQRVPVTIYFHRSAKDVIGYVWGDGGMAKGQFDCGAGRLVWFRGGHIPSQLPVAAVASGRIVCMRGAQRQRLFVPAVGWGCAN